MRLVLMGLTVLTVTLVTGCAGARSDAPATSPSATPAPSAASDRSPAIAPTVPPTPQAGTATPAPPPSAPPGQVECTLEERWRSEGLVRLTVSPSAPRPGDHVTVTGSGLRAPGRYDLNISDLDEVEIKVGEVEVGNDRLINGTFLMPTLRAIYSGNGLGPCIAVTIRGATDFGQRFISAMFPRP